MLEKGSYLEGKKILAVDDEEDVLEIIEEELEIADIDTALDYQTASVKIIQNKYDLVILDIMGVDGLSLLEKAVERKMPVVMLTAHAMNYETLMLSIRKGSISFLPKEKLAELFQKGSGQTKVMEVFGPNIIHGTFDDVKFSLANMLKDLHLYRNLAEDEGVPTSISASALQLFTVASYKGANQQDSTAVAELLTHQVRT